LITQSQLADRRMMIQAAAERMRSRKAQMSRIKKATTRVASAVSQSQAKKSSSYWLRRCRH